MSNKTLADLSVQQLKRAVALRERIDALQEELASITGGSATGVARGHRGRRKMSRAARAKIAAAAKARWAKAKAANRRTLAAA